MLHWAHLPHSVDVSDALFRVRDTKSSFSTVYTPRDQVLAWLYEQDWHRNTHWTFELLMFVGGGDSKFQFAFDDANKALMFKLAWGGK